MTATRRFDVFEAAERLGIAPFTLRRKARERQIAHFRASPRGKIFFSEQHLADFEQINTYEIEEREDTKKAA